MFQRLIFLLSFLALCTAAAFVYLESGSSAPPVSTVFPLNDMSAVSIGGTQPTVPETPPVAETEKSDAVFSGVSETRIPMAEALPPPPLPNKRIRISKEACRRLKSGSAAVPADYRAGVSTTGKTVASADYQPGVSTTGKAVAPADLNGGYAWAEPDLQDIELPISVDLEKNFPFFQSSLEMGTVPVGNVTFKDGKVYMNGVLLSDDAANVLREQCP